MNKLHVQKRVLLYYATLKMLENKVLGEIVPQVEQLLTQADLTASRLLNLVRKFNCRTNQALCTVHSFVGSSRLTWKGLLSVFCADTIVGDGEKIYLELSQY
jgi:hypothetical protein